MSDKSKSKEKKCNKIKHHHHHHNMNCNSQHHHHHVSHGNLHSTNCNSYQTLVHHKPLSNTQLVNKSVRQQPQGHVNYEYQPITKTYVDYEPQQKIEYVPVQKHYTDYNVIAHETTYQPVTRLEKRVEYVPQEYMEEHIDYVPQHHSYNVGEVSGNVCNCNTCVGQACCVGVPNKVINHTGYKPYSTAYGYNYTGYHRPYSRYSTGYRTGYGAKYGGYYY